MSPSLKFHLPHYYEIPDVGLFLEQVSKYLSTYINPLFNLEITNSMISNYVKKGMINNPIKKQYGREQIAQLFFISLAKNVLNLDDINELLKIQRANYDAQDAYEYFIEEFSHIVNAIFEGEDIKSNLNEDDPIEKVLLRNIAITVAHKAYLNLGIQRLKNNS